MLLSVVRFKPLRLLRSAVSEVRAVICEAEVILALVASEDTETVWLVSSAEVPAVAVTALLDELACLARNVPCSLRLETVVCRLWRSVLIV